VSYTNMVVLLLPPLESFTVALACIIMCPVVFMVPSVFETTVELVSAVLQVGVTNSSNVSVLKL